jgi:hypothetical protein
MDHTQRGIDLRMYAFRNSGVDHKPIHTSMELIGDLHSGLWNRLEDPCRKCRRIWGGKQDRADTVLGGTVIYTGGNMSSSKSSTAHRMKMELGAMLLDSQCGRKNI